MFPDIRRAASQLKRAEAPGAEAGEPMTLDDLPGFAEVAITDGQRRGLMAEASRCLAEIADLEALVEEQGLAATPEAEAITRGRERVQAGLQALNAARRQDRAAPAPLTPPPPTTRPAMPAFTHTLGQVQGGVTEGPEVESLQRFLGTQGLAVAVTGIYDQQTAAAVRMMQHKLGLKRVNAVVGVETRQAFNRLLAQGT